MASRIVAIALLVLSAATAIRPAQAQNPVPAAQGGPITPADIMKLHDMRDVALSPDGKTVLFTVQQQMSTFNSPHRTIWTVPGDGSAPARPFIVSAGVDAAPHWSPDGKWVAFLSNRPDPLLRGKDGSFAFSMEAVPGSSPPVAGTPPAATPQPGTSSTQLWLMPVHGGEAIPLTAMPSDVTDIAWSPDGTKIAFLSVDPQTAAEKAAKAAGKNWIEVDHDTHFSRLWILDLATHTARRVSPGSINVSAMDWSPDGKRMALRIADTPGINDYFYHSRIVLFDPATGKVGKTLLDHAAEGPFWSPDGKSVLGEAIRLPGFIGLGVRICDVATGTVRALADAYPALFTNVRWSTDGKSVLALSFEKTRSNIVRIAADTGTVTPVVTLNGESSDFDVSADGKRMVAQLSSPDRPSDVWTIADGKARPITRINAEVEHWKLGKVRQIHWKNHKDGKTIYGVLVTPPDYRPGTPTKMVVQIHGGPEWAWWAGWLGSWHEWAQMLATHGYVVFLPNPRGSDGQGTDFARAVGNDWGGMDYQDIMDGVDTLIKDKIADPNRLGIGGWSYGGFMSAWAVTHTNRFKAAVVGAAPTDLVPFARITDTPDFPLGYFGDVTTHMADYDRRSSARMLQNVHTPVLVMDGMDDTRVPITLSLEFYRGLKMLGKPAEMVKYPDEPHWFHDPVHQQDVQRRVLAWFDAHL
ncbi:dipeptidyl aminopeptidase/acylaminoacyl peptidase [Stakelama sediminis]|uniref:Dipeptidyl aminopeptidase/acylaminoacyl peptidase n=1 Tax=Stakelama sediminis TaxID=463200 RepID=A0A840Z2W3_9SPHN|nr:S9 family peptidase [Stakelama sediminis]MBB5720338.1 dipeptidyl aminopeptidase/acylaminoacyl peptidase [Stakelama sediminis]